MRTRPLRRMATQFVRGRSLAPSVVVALIACSHPAPASPTTHVRRNDQRARLHESVERPPVANIDAALAGLSPSEKERLRPFISTVAPPPQHALNVRFANGLELIGYDVSDDADAGLEINVRWYWHPTRRIERGWRLLTHVANGDDVNVLNCDHEGVVREIFPPERWPPGSYVVDEQSITLPPDWNSDRAIFYLGLWRDGDRVPVERGPVDDALRVRALSLRLGVP